MDVEKHPERWQCSTYTLGVTQDSTFLKLRIWLAASQKVLETVFLHKTGVIVPFGTKIERLQKQANFHAFFCNLDESLLSFLATFFQIWIAYNTLPCT